MEIKDKLFELALRARENAYCPYSKFKLGSALVTDKGNFYTGCNIENAAYAVTACGERTAVFTMVAAGERKIKELLVVADGDVLISPCGVCRQVIQEFSDPDTIIHMANLNGIQKSAPMKEVLPFAFTEYKSEE